MVLVLLIGSIIVGTIALIGGTIILLSDSNKQDDAPKEISKSNTKDDSIDWVLLVAK